MLNAHFLLRRQPSATTGISCLIGLLGALLLCDLAQAQQTDVDDGWRRTRFGWENIKHWNLAPEQREVPGQIAVSPLPHPTTESPSLGLHPLAFAIGLTLLAVTPLWLVPTRETPCEIAITIDAAPGSAI